jgi:hypothetical protein
MAAFKMGKEQEQKIIGIVEELSERNPYASCALGMMAGAALDYFNPEKRKYIPHLYTYFKNCLKEGVPPETIREVVRLARS